MKHLFDIRRKSRTSKAIGNVVYSAFFKAVSILVSFVLIPMTLGYLNNFEYGIWLTLNSILTWVGMFDIGLDNGLRNKLAESLARNDKDSGRIYVSTTFFTTIVIVITIYIFFLIAQKWFNWYSILNIGPQDTSTDINSLVLIIMAMFCTSMIFKITGNVYMAKQLSVVNDLLFCISNILSLIVIYFLVRYTKGNLAYVAYTYSISPLLVSILSYIFTFKFVYRDLSPSLKRINIHYLKDLIGLGVNFFIIQVAVLLIFMTSNFILAQVLGPAEVTPYNICFKYFSIITMGFTILMAPFWSAVTDAFVKGELTWIYKNLQRIRLLWFISVFGLILMIICSQMAFRLWVGDMVHISHILTISLALYAGIVNWNNIYAYFINGIGKIRIQLYCSVGSIILYVMTAVPFTHRWGSIGLAISLSISLLPSAIFLPIQMKKILKGKARGVWNK